MLWLLEVLDELLGHNNFSLKGIILLLHLSLKGLILLYLSFKGLFLLLELLLAIMGLDDFSLESIIFHRKLLLANCNL